MRGFRHAVARCHPSPGRRLTVTWTGRKSSDWASRFPSGRWRTPRNKRQEGDSHANVYLTILRDVEAFWNTVDRSGSALVVKIRRARTTLRRLPVPRVKAEVDLEFKHLFVRGSVNGIYAWLNDMFGNKTKPPQATQHLDKVLQDLDTSDPAYAFRIRAAVAEAKEMGGGASPASSSGSSKAAENEGNDAAATATRRRTDGARQHLHAVGSEVCDRV